MRRKTIEEIEAEIINAVEGGIVPCVVLGILEKGRRHVFAYGHSRLIPKKEAVRRDTLFDLASLTKVVVTTPVILGLVLEGRFALDTPVCDILKRYRHPETEVIDLLTHRSGLPRLDWRRLSAEEFVDKIYDAELPAEGNNRYVYCDTNYLLLGFIADEIGGGLGVCGDDFLGRLCMRDTFFNPAELKKNLCAATEFQSGRGIVQGEVHDEKSFLLGGVTGHAGLFSTIDDMLTFALFMLSKGSMPLAKPTLLNEGFFDLLSQNFTPGLEENQTLGWKLLGEGCLYHTGFTGTSMILDMKRERACVILANRVHPYREDRGFFALRDRINSIFGVSNV